MNEVYGFKVFSPDWTCRGKQYTCPGRFTEDVEPLIGEIGMHFCETLSVLALIAVGYAVDNNCTPLDLKYASVVSHGRISRDTDIHSFAVCTDDLEVIEEIPFITVNEACRFGPLNVAAFEENVPDIPIPILRKAAAKHGLRLIKDPRIIRDSDILDGLPKSKEALKKLSEAEKINRQLAEWILFGDGKEKAND